MDTFPGDKVPGGGGGRGDKINCYTGLQFHSIDICLKGACAFTDIVYVGAVGFTKCLLFLDSDKR